MMFVTEGKQCSRYIGRSCEIACFLFSKTSRYKAMAPTDIVYCQLEIIIETS